MNNFNLLVIESNSDSLFPDLREAWRYRTLFSQLIIRDIRLRYRQAFLGIVWVLLQALLPSVIFAVIFGVFFKLPSGGNDYFPFVMAGMVIWAFFSQIIMRVSNCLVVNSSIITKVYFPRIILPLATTGAIFFDFIISILVLLVILLIYHVDLTSRLIFIPIIFIWAFMASIGIGLWISALNVKYRDFTYALPFLMQVWFYGSPIVYSTSTLPINAKIIFSINPICGIIEAFRWAIFGHTELNAAAFYASVVTSLTMFVYGLYYFHKLERSLADTI